MHVSDRVAVHIDDRSIRQNAPDDIAVRVANQPVFADITQKLAVRPVNRTPDHIRRRADLTDNVAARINDRSVRHDLTDNVTVRIADITVCPHITQKLSVGAVNRFADKALYRRSVILRVHHGNTAQFLAVVPQCTPVRHQTSQNFFVFVDDRSVEMNRTDIIVFIFTHFADGNDTPQKFTLVRQGTHRRRNIADFFQIVVRNPARRQNGTDNPSVTSDNPASERHNHADFLAGLVRHVARFRPDADGRARSRLDNVFPADQPADEFALHIDNVFPCRTDADHFVLFINDRTFGRKASHGTSLRIQHFTAADDITDRLAVKSDAFAFANQAADTLSVRIRHGAVKRDAPQGRPLHIGDFAVGSHLADNLASPVDHGSLGDDRTDQTVPRVQNTVVIGNAPDRFPAFAANRTVGSHRAEKTARTPHRNTVDNAGSDRPVQVVDNRVIRRQTPYFPFIGVRHGTFRIDRPQNGIVKIQSQTVRNGITDHPSVRADKLSAGGITARNLANDVAVHLNDGSVRKDTADDVSVRIAYQAVCADITQKFAVRPVNGLADHIRGGGDLTDDIAVHVNDGSVRTKPADNVTVRIPDQTVFADIPQKLAVRSVNRLAYHVFGRANLADRLAVHINDGSVRKDTAYNVSVRIAYQSVLAHIPQKLAVRPVNSPSDERSVGRHLTDDVAVHVDNRTIGHDAADNVAVRIANKSVFAHITQKFAVRPVNRTPHHIGGRDVPYDVPVRINDASVRQNATDNIPVSVANQTVCTDITQKLAVRPVNGATEELGRNNRSRLADGISVGVNQFAVRPDVTDDFAVGSQNRFTDGNDFTDDFAGRIIHTIVQVGSADDPSRSVHNSAVGKQNT